MSNWKAPGPDRLHVFWVKKLTALHERIAAQLNSILRQPQSMPEWLVKGRTVLIRKDMNKEPTPDNYRPITCLPTIWKTFSGMIADRIMQHVTNNRVMSFEQKGARPGSRGTKEQLAIDRSVTEDNKKRHTNLAMAWIDYQKAYDSVPHTWITRCLEIYKIDKKIQQLIQTAMLQWKTMLTHGKTELGEIQIKRGIFQGDSLSPVLFCIALNPLSQILHKTGKEYVLGNGHKINHLLYMDDLKLYSKKEEDLNSLIRSVRSFSEDIGMRFGFNKCARLIIHRGKVKETTGLEVQDGIIRDVLKEGYKYLGIPQQRTNLADVTKNQARKEYKRRLKQVLKTRLYGSYKIEAINAFAIPVISYTGGVIKWTKQELDEINRQTRKILNMYGGLHPRADVHRLYLPRRMGGRGLKDIAEVIEDENRSLIEHIWNTTDDPLLALVKSNVSYQQKEDTHVSWRSQKIQEREAKWKEKPLHGQYPRQIEQVTDVKTRYNWLKTVRLKIETEALLTAAQDQALKTKAHNTYITKTATDPKCRMCGIADETIAHLLSGCQTLAANIYTTRHNEVAKCIHRDICKSMDVQVEEQPWQHQPLDITETEDFKLLWDFDICTDRHIRARRPDLVLVNKRKKCTLLIDISVPDDRNIKEKEREKIEKYQDLRIEVQRLWNTKTEVVPVVIGALGAYTPKLKRYLEKIPGTHNIPELMKAALLGSAHILRRCLDLPESW